MQTERLREKRWEPGAGPRPHHRAVHTQHSPYSPAHTGILSCTLPSTHPHRRLILPSPHPPPPPPGSKIKATRDAATVLSLLGKTEPLSAGTGRTSELLGCPRLGPKEAWALAPVLVQHQLHPFPGGIHVKVPTELLLKPAPFLLENIPLWVFSRHAEARKVNPSVFRIDLIDFASIAGWLQYLLIYTSLRPGLQG